MLKKLLIFFLGMIGMLTLGMNTHATDIQNSEYFYFYALGCSHCIKVEHYFEQSKIDKKIQISAYEILHDQEGIKTLENLLPEVNLSLTKIGTPFLIIKSADGEYSSLMGETPIIEYFKQMEKQLPSSAQTENREKSNNTNPDIIVSNTENLRKNNENNLS